MGDKPQKQFHMTKYFIPIYSTAPLSTQEQVPYSVISVFESQARSEEFLTNLGASPVKPWIWTIDSRLEIDTLWEQVTNGLSPFEWAAWFVCVNDKSVEVKSLADGKMKEQWTYVSKALAGVLSPEIIQAAGKKIHSN